VVRVIDLKRPTVSQAAVAGGPRIDDGGKAA
jgi:hypothetical protein